MRHRHIDEVEAAAFLPIPQEDLGALFAPLPHPTAPAVCDAEQRTLPIPSVTLTGDYAAWRDTQDGRFSYASIRRQAISEAQAGTRVLSAKALVEWCRATHRIRINNSHTALIARELYDAEPGLRPLFKLRRRSAG